MTDDKAGDESVDVVEQVGFLIGRFEGPELMHDTAWAPGGPATGRTVGRTSSSALLQEQTQERDGEVSFSALNVFAIDPATGEVVMYSFDSVGFLPDPPARGTWAGDELVLARSTARGHSRTRYSRTPDGYRWAKEYRQTETADWSAVAEGRMRAE